MLKKVIIGIIILIILAVGGLGAYIYMMDWNKHKASVALKISQITGLKTVIDGNLSVELFPTPQFSANKVKFMKNNGGKEPLIVINNVKATTELGALLDNNFIIKSMTLTDAAVYVTIDEKGNSNWAGVNRNGKNKSGNIEVSFNDTTLNNFTLQYKNLRDKKEFTVPNISATISAPALSGPYKTKGKFIYNGGEIIFNGSIVNEQALNLNLGFTNANSGTRFSIDGTVGNDGKGDISFDTKSLKQINQLIFGENTLPPVYDKNLAIAFKYQRTADAVALDNFAIKFGENIAGSGSLNLQTKDEKPQIDAEFDMAKFDLMFVEELAKSLIDYTKEKKSPEDNFFLNSRLALSLKSDHAVYKKADINDLSLAMNYDNGVIDLTRLSMVASGDTSIKTVGKININNGFDYIFSPALNSANLRYFAAIFDLDITKLATAENKKNIFKKAAADFILQGNLETLKLDIAKATIDSTDFKGNIGFIFGEQPAVVADIEASTIIFDKYIQALPDNLKDAPLKAKFLHQLNLLPWPKDISVDGNINLASAVYNNIPLEKFSITFNTAQDKLNIKNLTIANMAGANIRLNMEADKIYTEPYFTALDYEVKTANFPLLTSTLGINLGDNNLFKRKIFATQGSLSGSFDAFSLSSIQKFGDTEFLYTGSVQDSVQGLSLDGNLELKTNNFADFIKAVNIDYKLDIPVTTFTLNSKISGVRGAFSATDINAYLGANNITGRLMFDKRSELPSVTAELDFDRFDADKWLHFDFENRTLSQKKNAAFIAKPQFSDKKTDYSSLKKANFNLKLNAKTLAFDNTLYQNAEFDGVLNKGVLKVALFKALQKETDIALDFTLDSNSLAKIEGNFDVKNFFLPDLGGDTYALKGGKIDAKGNFASTATSEEEFWENLTSKGSFKLSDTTFCGWDLDIIKFDLEQRKIITGFDEMVNNSLKSGKSVFTTISGDYAINKGVVLADDVLWTSPVISMNTKFNLNLNDWLFSALFEAIYSNASFSDVIKFSYDGNLSSPVLKTDFSESIQRISEIDKQEKEKRAQEERERNKKFNEKTSQLKFAVNSAAKTINRLSIDASRYKPETDNKEVNYIYDNALRDITKSEAVIRRLQEMLLQSPAEDDFIAIESELNAEETKLQIIPKTLEENYLIDSKYVYEDTFNKIIWLYNLAQNNFSYYDGLSDIYMQQVNLLKDSDKAVSPEDFEKLTQGTAKIKNLIDEITQIHTTIRDKYLTIIDTSRVSEMKKSNAEAKQALSELLALTKRLNDDIIDNIDIFRAVLEINSRDYDEYIVFPPDSVEEIDVKQPVTKAKSGPAAIIQNFKKAALQAQTAADVKLSSFNQGLASLLDKVKKKEPAEKPAPVQTENKDISLASNLTFDGLAQLIPPATDKNEGKSAGDAMVKSAEISDKPISQAPSAPQAEAKNNDNIIAKPAQTPLAQIVTQLKNAKHTVEALLTAHPRSEQAEEAKLPAQTTQNVLVQAATEPVVDEPAAPLLTDDQIMTQILAASPEITQTIQTPLTAEAPVYTPKEEPTAQRYVFAATPSPFGTLSGYCGKTILQHQQTTVTSDRPQTKYVFAQADKPLRLTGNAQKAFLLAVK